MKNDITYEYRVFTNRLVDVESMKVGECSSKVIKELKQKDKVEGRFFHTTDSDEWFFYWKGKLQKLNLKGDSDVNAALEEVRKLIGEASSAVDNVNEIAKQAKDAADEAKTAADAVSTAVESIGNKADKKDVADVKSVVDELSDKVDAIKVPSLDGYATESYVDDKVDGKFDVTGSAAQALDDAKKSAAELYQVKGDYITKEELSDLDVIRSGAAAGATALQSVPSEYVTETELTEKGYLTKDVADSLYGSGESIDLSKYAEIEYVNNNFDAAGSADAALDAAIADAAEKYQVKGNYLTEHQSLDNYYTKEQINAMIGVAKDLTDEILNEDTTLNA